MLLEPLDILTWWNAADRLERLLTPIQPDFPCFFHQKLLTEWARPRTIVVRGVNGYPPGSGMLRLNKLKS